MRVLLAGMLVRVPDQGGATWATLQWVLGLRRLGHDVEVVEQLPAAPTPAQRRWAAALARSGVRVHLVHGPSTPQQRRDLRADVLVNLSGVLRDEALLAGTRRRLYVDLDPGFTQVWAAQGADLGLAGHDVHATVGLRVGTPGCTVPDLGLSWVPTPPPVVLDRWSPGAPVRHRAATSVGNWRSYGSPTWRGVALGQRAHAARALLPLAARSPLPLRLALGIAAGETADLAALHAAGWRLLDPLRVARTPGAYRRFVRGSAAELGIAKAGYVVTASGWFSDRSACYLAAGRPVVAQETGWSTVLPEGAGLHAYADADAAATALERVLRDPAGESAAAHGVAREHLDSDRVLTRLLDRTAA